MRNKLILIISTLLTIFSLATPTVRADMIMPIFSILIIFFPMVWIVESVLFWLLGKYFFLIKTSFLKSLLVVGIANVITSTIGFFFPIPLSLGGLVIGIVLSSICEFIFFLLFFDEKEANRINLFLLSLIINASSYSLILLVLPLL